MTEAPLVWHGTVAEGDALMDALNRGCTCVYDGRTGARLSTCPGHQLLLDPTALDHLVYARRLRERLLREEWA